MSRLKIRESNNLVTSQLFASGAVVVVDYEEENREGETKEVS